MTAKKPKPNKVMKLLRDERFMDIVGTPLLFTIFGALIFSIPVVVLYWLLFLSTRKMKIRQKMSGNAWHTILFIISVIIMMLLSLSYIALIDPTKLL